MQDAGIFVTQIGASVTTAADYQFVFNSNWPSLQTAFEKLVTLSPSSSVTLTHHLNIYPLTLAWAMQGGVSLGRLYSTSATFYNPAQTDVTMAINKSSIILTNSSSSNTYEIDVACYNVDITQSVNYTLPKFPAVNQPYDATTGIKIAKFNKQITSTDLRDFILHSRAQSPAILAIVTGNTGTSNRPIYYNNPANYTPWTFAYYADTSGNYYGLAPGHQQSGALFELGQNLTFGSPAVTVANGALMTSTIDNTNMSLVILRDPLVVPKVVEAMY